MVSRDPQQRQLSPILRWFLFTCGLFAVALGVVGLFLPGLPTVPFLLLAVACFARSSERFYSWLLEHDHLGPLVRPYLDGRGLKRATKCKAITLVWVSITVSIVLLDGQSVVQVILVVIACGVSLYLARLPSAEPG